MLEALVRAAVALGATLLAALILLIVWVFVAVMPTDIMAHRDCLAQGYPKVETTITLESYCINLDGAVTNAVVPVEEVR